MNAMPNVIAELAREPDRLPTSGTDLGVSREERFALLAHAAPSVRVAAAWHLLERWPEDAGRLSPLWIDATRVDGRQVRFVIFCTMSAAAKRSHAAIAAELARMALDVEIG